MAEDLEGDKLVKAMSEENREIKWGIRAPVRLGNRAYAVPAAGIKATVVRFEVHRIENAERLIKERVKIGGKVRKVELFQLESVRPNYT